MHPLLAAFALVAPLALWGTLAHYFPRPVIVLPLLPVALWFTAKQFVAVALVALPPVVITIPG